MYWVKVFGESMLARVEDYIGERKMSITALVRLAVEEYLNNREG